ncbi:hypothetical protein QO010_004733 [Caulobacter ginsengisoli]|uniref:DUF4864 domain-containing protein n=1 Tax=Caulobacter ginsengisoli TaxID=400775 RepID=A0ABU0J060_9CAUL|nr:hypothetical protein [Caulobacter ginsengisoli]MDQ0466936.1 hypothetical protein [Caulobacter ginsengisoli]
MFRVIAAALVLLFGVAQSAQARQAAPLPPEATVQANQFFTTLQEGRGSEAFKTALKDLMPAVGEANVDAGVMGMNQLTKGLGSILDWSVFRVNVDSPNVKQVTFLVRYEKLPMFYTLTFYNPGKGWRIVEIQGNTISLARTAGYLGPVQ